MRQTLDGPIGGRLAVVRGAGDIASGTGRRLFLSGFSVIMTEVAAPLCVRRQASFSEAVFDGTARVEEVDARRIEPAELDDFPFAAAIAVIIDPDARVIEHSGPEIVIDARMLKKNHDTRIDQGRVVGALGPGFHASVDCHFVVETQRGHDLGRVLYEGSTTANTGTPAERGGFSEDRVLYSVRSGAVEPRVEIGARVKAGQTLFRIDGVDHQARISGIVRGLVRAGIDIPRGVKVADVDPLSTDAACCTISDRSNAIAGGVLEGVLRTLGR